MKKRCISLLLAVLLMLSLPLGAFAADALPTEAEAYARMVALKSEYPEGMRWTNDDFYAWNGGIFSGGYGCAGFAFILSDAVFGDRQATMTDYSYDELRVGDILHFYTHFVIVLEKQTKGIVVAEGNYNSSIHWGRFISRATLDSSVTFTDGTTGPYVDYVLTRWPEPCNHDYEVTFEIKPTCTKDGITEYTCSLCGDVQTYTTYYNVSEHTWGVWTVVKEAVPGVPGEKTRRCSYCGDIETRPVLVFSDVFEKDWYHGYIMAAAEEGLVAGNSDGSYAPKAELTWAQTLVFATRLDQYNKGEDIYGSADQTGAWYQIYLDYCLENGIIDAAPANMGAAITRADAAMVFARVLGEGEKLNSVPEGYFSDLDASHPAYDAVYALAEAGIVNGMSDGSFGVDGAFQRSQVATIVARMAGLAEPVIIG